MENRGGHDVEAGPEDLLPQTSSDGTFPVTASTTHNPDITNTNNAVVNNEAKPEAKPNARPPTPLTTISRFGKSMACRIFLVTTCIAIFPCVCFAMYLAGVIKKMVAEREREKIFLWGGGGNFIRRKKPSVTKIKIELLSLIAALHLAWLLLAWLVLNLSVSRFRKVMLFDSPPWNWFLLSIVIILGYPSLLITYLFVRRRLIKLTKFKGSKVEYFVGGLEKSVRLLIYFTWIFIVWLLCVRTNNAALKRYGTSTLVSFLGGAVLYVVKSVALLWWKSKYIYERYEGKILLAGCQLYFHLHIMDQWLLPCSCDLVSWWEGKIKEKTEETTDNNGREIEKTAANNGRETKNRVANNGRASRRKIPPLEENMLNRGASLQHIDDVALCLTQDFELTLTEDDDMPDIVPYLRKKFASNRQEFSIMTIPCKSRYFSKNQARLMLELLQLETSKKTPTYDQFEKWMVDGLKNCYAVGLRLNGAFELMSILDRVFTGFIVVAFVLIWLFITGFATTKAVVELASVFFGLTFIFGDTCKIFFQGIIFAFVNRPFDVGDRCIIGENELKVEKINILTTAFFASQMKANVQYLNSDLLTKPIFVHEDEPGPEPKPQTVIPPDVEDVTKLNLRSSTTTSQIRELQKRIERYLEDGIESGQYKKPYRVRLMEIGDNMEMSIHFKYNLQEDGNLIGEQLDSVEIRRMIDDLSFFFSSGNSSKV